MNSSISLFLLLLIWIVIIIHFTIRRKIELKNSEQKLIDVGARYFGGLLGVGGRMIITTERIIFQPSVLSFIGKSFDIAFDQVDDVNKMNKANIITIQNKSGKKYNFYILSADRILREIKRNVSHLNA
jgi:hypothetical protein